MNLKKKEWILYAAWACLYILTVGLGTVEEIAGIGKAFFILTSLIFFIPGVWLLLLGKKTQTRNTVLRVRIIALCSLLLTALVFCINLLGVGASAEAGAVLHDLLNLVSAPMFCSQYWILSIFLWACLLSASFTVIKKERGYARWS